MTEISDSSSLKVELAIIGAGPVGTSLAILAARAGFATLLVDARDPDAAPPQDTRNFAIVRGSWRLLGATGVHHALAGQTEPLLGLEATDGGRHWFGAPSVLFDTVDLPEDDQGEPLGQMVPAAALQAALDTVAADEPNLTWWRNTRFAGLTTGPAHALITMEDGRTVHAGLVAACDGVNSGVRKALGITTEGRAYGKSVFAADVKLSRPHEGLARQLFTPEGPFATLPLPGNRANLAWYMKTGAAEAMAKQPAEAIEAELNARFSNFAGPMTLDGPPLAYPLHLKLATRLVAQRGALLGDAAHRINPLAGQGLNLGFKDVGALIDVMTESRSVGLDPGSDTSLQRYQQWRRFDAATAAMFMDVVDRAFSNDNAILKPLRGLALTAASRIGPIRRAMARQASADQPSLPSLMR
ncbi:FAD-dependent monooxygenase [Hyphomonas oceanitis]|uniref:FAD-dependent monooxygenase n=1 Tax=Hyphomonas oceanitis TaxID=81033 RepID=UPI0030029C0D